jgi:excinuclease ABC subunit A
LVVEHDEETMRRADYIIDLGPGAGIHGGTVAGAGTLEELMANPHSITGQALREKRTFPARGSRREVKRSSPRLKLQGASLNNLKNVSAAFPLRRFVVVTGVSGSGKSTLIHECLLPSLRGRLAREKSAGPCKVSGFESIKAVYEVDQSPVGRTPRSTPATYVGFFDVIRQLFSQIPEARLRGYGPGRFSFNSAQGRCPQCEGAGQIKLEMNFLPPAYILCDMCGGTRFNRETLDIAYNGRSIAQVLEMSIEEGIGFFAAIPRVRRPLEALRDTGLDYLKLGQISPTLSGGEAQRMKLVTHLLAGMKEQPDLIDPDAKRNLFVLEEPTIGLHMSDVKRLVEVLQKLVDAGHTVIVIEHNLDLIAEADWVIDLGPEGGGAGGEIIAEGTPEQVGASKSSHTGRFLRAMLR